MVVLILCGAGAAVLVGWAVWWRWIRTGAYRAAQDAPRLDLGWSWLLIPAAAAGGAVAGLLGWSWLFAGAWLYLVSGAVVAWIDLDVHRIENRVLIPVGGALLVLLAAAAAGEGGWPMVVRAVGGALMLGGLFALLSIAGSMGAGDMKLAAVTGLIVGTLGWPSLAVTLGAAFAVAGITGVARLAAGASRTTHVAMGPAIILGGAVAITLSQLT